MLESVFANLKGQMPLEQHLAKTPAGLAVRIAQRILALTLGILLNTPPDAPHAPSPPTTADKPHQVSRGACGEGAGLVAPQTVMTTFPRA